MPRLTKIYTRGGDTGKTSLGGGQRIPKNHPRIRSYGTVDELNSTIGVAIALGVCEKLQHQLLTIQNELFHLGSDLCFIEEDKLKYNIPQIEARHITAMETLIDELNESVGALENFILPGGAAGSAQLHVARTVCRRAEREIIELAEEEAIGEYVLPYLNRLSDALFVMARYENQVQGIADPLWNSHL